MEAFAAKGPYPSSQKLWSQKKKKKSHGIRPTCIERKAKVTTITATFFSSTFRPIAAEKAKGDGNFVESELLPPLLFREAVELVGTGNISESRRRVCGNGVRKAPINT